MNAKELSDRLAEDAAGVAAYLLPAGKKSGPEWKIGGTGGQPGQSLSVRISGNKRGVWSDFATGDKGDLLDLWAQVRGLSILQSMREAADYLGVKLDMPEKPARVYQRPCQAQISRTESQGTGMADARAQAQR